MRTIFLLLHDEERFLTRRIHCVCSVLAVIYEHIKFDMVSLR